MSSSNKNAATRAAAAAVESIATEPEYLLNIDPPQFSVY
jgi:hypothetical protein